MSDNQELWPSLSYFDPHITKEQWKKYLEQIEMPSHRGCMSMLKKMLLAGGDISCKALSQKFGSSSNSYIGSAACMGGRAKDYFHINLVQNVGPSNILFFGHEQSNNNGRKLYAFVLRPELKQALQEMDLSKFEPLKDVYNKEKFLSEVFLKSENYDLLISTLEHKKNLILQGPPGTGKTFIAKRLAYAMMGRKDKSHLLCLQFHQSYSYEDFIEGLRPNQDGNFVLKKGPFLDFCKKAADNQQEPYIVIIDEINRGNTSKIFGELFMLLEADKRKDAGDEASVKLLYSGEEFTVPQNLYIIGTMNTADRSLAMLDYALRRRFAFYNIGPAFDSEGFKRYLQGINDDYFCKLIDYVKELNDAIEKDESLGSGFRIGHSFFCNQVLTEGKLQPDALQEIVRFEIIPLLTEYWFDEPDKVKAWMDKLEGTVR